MIPTFEGFGVVDWTGIGGEPRVAYHFGEQVLGHLMITRDYYSPDTISFRVYVTGEQNLSEGKPKPKATASVSFQDMTKADHPWQAFVDAMKKLNRETGIPLDDLSKMAFASNQMAEAVRFIREIVRPPRPKAPVPAPPPPPPIETKTVDLKKGWNHWMNNIAEGIMRAPRKVPRAIVKKDGDA